VYNAAGWNAVLSVVADEDLTTADAAMSHAPIVENIRPYNVALAAIETAAGEMTVP
jgi:hypothetical protein